MVKEKKSPKKKRSVYLLLLYFFGVCFIFLSLFVSSLVFFFEKTYRGRIYPGVRVDNIIFGGKSPEDAEEYFHEKSKPFSGLTVHLNFENNIATLSGKELDLSYDGKLAAVQAYAIGRSGNFLSDTYQKWRASTFGINLSSVFKINTDVIDELLINLAAMIDIPAQDALFQFEKGKVISFRLSKQGRFLDQTQTKKLVNSYIRTLAYEDISIPQKIEILLPVEPAQPRVSTENSNNYGIKELLGTGTSKFAGSIPGRVHNINLAASKINGHLIPPETVFSFNEILGDVSAATGFQPAYIIKDGRTVLGDGGGVCQVSTTFFRAALNTGLPILERHPHSYRVSYYEQGSPPGLDATVFAPSYDLKIKNDTAGYILIQTKIDLQNYSLTFELYGTKDDRKIEITKPVILSQTAPPPDLYQDDPTLPKGVVKQVDWKAWGAKVNFDYKVTKNNETVFQKSFFSHFQPWQSVFLRGIKD